MKWSGVLVLATMLAGAAGCRSASARPISKLPFHDDISFRGFAEEALYGYGTPRTHRFDDYTKGSYHVHPREIAEGLFKVAASYGLQLEAVAVVGPYGPLWAYDVISIVREEGCARVNWLVMPHARITVKRSGCVTPEAVSAFLADMREVAPLPEPIADQDSCAIVAQASSPRWSRFACDVDSGPPEFDRMDRALDSLSKALVVTYSGYPPVEE